MSDTSEPQVKEPETTSEEVEVEVEVVDEASAETVVAGDEKVEVVEEQEDELEDYSKNVQKRIKQLTDKYRKEERDKQEALRLSSELMEENKKIKDRLKLLDRGYVQEYGNRLDIEMNTAKIEYKNAADSGDSDGMLDASQKLTRLTTELDRHKQAKARVEREAKQPVTTEPAPGTVPAQPAPQAVDPKAEAWTQRNEWFGKDRLLTAATYAIHATLLEDEGFDASSDEYYSEIDRRLRSEFPNKFQGSKKTSERSQVVSAASSASRSNKSGRRSVKLSPSQVAIARKLNVPLEEYAKFVKD